MRLGIFIGTMGSATGLEGQVQQVVDAEQDGFDSFWAAQVSGVDVMTLFALAGSRTTRIEMGTAVVPIFTRHPLVLAQQSMTTQAALDGRLTLGIGLSHKPVVEDRWGLSFDRPALRMREYLSVLRELIGEGTVSFKGQVFSVDASLQVPGPAQLPIVVAALGPMMLRLAGELAEGTVTWMVGEKTLDTHIVPRITSAAHAVGRPSPRVCVGVPVAVTDDPDAGRERAAQAFARYGQLPSYRRMLDLEGNKDPGDIVVVGDEREVERQLRGLADLGTTDLLASIFPVGDDPEASAARTRALLRELVGKV